MLPKSGRAVSKSEAERRIKLMGERESPGNTAREVMGQKPIVGFLERTVHIPRISTRSVHHYTERREVIEAF